MNDTRDTVTGPQFAHEMGAVLLDKSVQLDDASACIRELIAAGYPARVVAAEVDAAIQAARDAEAQFGAIFPVDDGIDHYALSNGLFTVFPDGTVFDPDRDNED